MNPAEDQAIRAILTAPSHSCHVTIPMPNAPQVGAYLELDVNSDVLTEKDKEGGSATVRAGHGRWFLEWAGCRLRPAQRQGGVA